jgi:hypothetical protein
MKLPTIILLLVALTAAAVIKWGPDQLQFYAWMAGFGSLFIIFFALVLVPQAKAEIRDVGDSQE